MIRTFNDAGRSVLVRKIIVNCFRAKFIFYKEAESLDIRVKRNRYIVCFFNLTLLDQIFTTTVIVLKGRKQPLCHLQFKSTKAFEEKSQKSHAPSTSFLFYLFPVLPISVFLN